MSKKILFVLTLFLVVTATILIWILMNPKNSDAWYNENPVPSLKPSVSPTCSPSVRPSVSPFVSPSPSVVVSPNPSVAGSPTPTPGNTSQGAGNSGPTSDGLGCGSHDCSVHPVVIPSAAPNTGRAEE